MLIFVNVSKNGMLFLDLRVLGDLYVASQIYLFLFFDVLNFNFHFNPVFQDSAIQHADILIYFLFCESSGCKLIKPLFLRNVIQIICNFFFCNWMNIFVFRYFYVRRQYSFSNFLKCSFH